MVRRRRRQTAASGIAHDTVHICDGRGCCRLVNSGPQHFTYWYLVRVALRKERRGVSSSVSVRTRRQYWVGLDEKKEPRPPVRHIIPVVGVLGACVLGLQPATSNKLLLGGFWILIYRACACACACCACAVPVLYSSVGPWQQAVHRSAAHRRSDPSCYAMLSIICMYACSAAALPCRPRAATFIRENTYIHTSTHVSHRS